MDKNTLIGILLIGVIFIAFMFVNQQEQEAINQAQADEQQDIITDHFNVKPKGKDSVLVTQNNNVIVENNENDTANSLNNSLNDQEIQLRKQKFGCFYPSLNGEKEYFTLENEKIRVKLSSLGAEIVEVSIVEKDENGI